MERHHRRGVGSRCFGLFFRLGLFLGLGMMIFLFVVTAAEAVEELQARHPQRTYSSSAGDVGEAMHRNLDVQLPEDEVQGVSGQQTSEARMVYKRLVPLPLSGRRASANLVPISPPSSNHFGSSFALRRIPQLEYRGEDFGLGGQGGQGGASDGQQAGFGRDFGGGQSGSSSSAASFRNNPPDLEGDSDFNLDDFSSFDLQNEDPQDGRHKRQHSEGGVGDEDYFFSGFGDLQEYGESDGQHGSGRDYDYFEDHDYQGGGDVGHTGGHAGGRGGSGSGGGGGHHDDGGDPSFNGDDFTHFEREFRGGITPTDYYEDYPAHPESTFEGSFHEGPQHGGGGGGGGGHDGGGISGKGQPHSNLSPTEFVENSGGFDFGSYGHRTPTEFVENSGGGFDIGSYDGPSSPSALGKGSPSSSSASQLPLQKYYEPPRYEPKPSLSSSSYLYK